MDNRELERSRRKLSENNVKLFQVWLFGQNKRAYRDFDSISAFFTPLKKNTCLEPLMNTSSGALYSQEKMRVMFVLNGLNCMKYNNTWAQEHIMNCYW